VFATLRSATVSSEAFRYMTVVAKTRNRRGVEPDWGSLSFRARAGACCRSFCWFHDGADLAQQGRLIADLPRMRD
jgi:hypothetical protein